MRKVEHFTDLEVWRKAHSLFVDIYAAIEKPSDRPGSKVLLNQIIRSSGSIGANISEGCLATSTREYVRYLNIAKRTTAETENWLYKLRDVGLMDRKHCGGFVMRCIEIQKMLSGLAKALKRYEEK
jgi:four helix bundle protein